MFNEMLQNTIRIAERLNPQSPCDYIGDDGFLHCGVCRAPKRGKTVTKSGTVFVHPVNCLCKLKEIEQEREAKAKEALILKRQQNRDIAFPDKATRNINFGKDDRLNPQGSAVARGYAASFEKTSKGLLFYGDCRVGKSFLAACIVNAIIDRGFSAKFTSMPEIEAELWNASNKKAVYDYFNGFDLLVLDDLFAERNSRYVSEIAFNVVDRRCRSGKPIIVTTNLTPKEIANASDIEQKRILSRLLEKCTSVLIKGADRQTGERKQTNVDEIERLLNYPLPGDLK